MKGSIHRTVAQLGIYLEDFSMCFHGVFYLFKGFRPQLVKSQIDRAAFKRKSLVFQKAVLSDKEFKAIGVVRQAIAGGEGFVRKNKILHFSTQSVFISATGIMISYNRNFRPASYRLSISKMDSCHLRKPTTKENPQFSPHVPLRCLRQRALSRTMAVTTAKECVTMLSENIRAIRKAKGLSQQELAAKLNVVRQTVSKWEQGVSHN